MGRLGCMNPEPQDQPSAAGLRRPLATIALHNSMKAAGAGSRPGRGTVLT